MDNFRTRCKAAESKEDVGQNLLAICTTVTTPCRVTQVRISTSRSVIS